MGKSEESVEESTYLSDEDEGMPLPVVFESLLDSETCQSSVPVIQHLKQKFHLYPLAEDIGR